MNRNYNKDPFAQTWVNGCDNIIVIAECSQGNKECGDMWQEVASFPTGTTLEEAVNWAINVGVTGRIMIRPDLSTQRREKI